MNLTPREKDKLLISMAAMVARRRLERGVKLNHPEAIALITDFVVEAARGMRLDIPAGTAVRFEPGQTREVTLVAIGGSRKIFGFRQMVMGSL